MKKKNTDPSRRELPGKAEFTFACNETVPCFTRCCKNADMLLYPYDIIRLKQALGMTSEDFLLRHTVTAFRDNPYFPGVMLKMTEGGEHPCPFLSEKGCTVYKDRPYSCRAYPLEPAMYGNGDNKFDVACRLVRHDHCLGHGRGKQWTADEWMADQDMQAYNEINGAWARVAALLHAPNAFGEKGADNPAMNMAYMASYNMDAFRRFVFQSSFLKRYAVPRDRIDRVEQDDTALMRLGFDWILRFLGGQGPLTEKNSP